MSALPVDDMAEHSTGEVMGIASLDATTLDPRRFASTGEAWTGLLSRSMSLRNMWSHLFRPETELSLSMLDRPAWQVKRDEFASFGVLLRSTVALLADLTRYPERPLPADSPETVPPVAATAPERAIAVAAYAGLVVTSLDNGVHRDQSVDIDTRALAQWTARIAGLKDSAVPYARHAFSDTYEHNSPPTELDVLRVARRLTQVTGELVHHLDSSISQGQRAFQPQAQELLAELREQLVAAIAAAPAAVVEAAATPPTSPRRLPEQRGSSAGVSMGGQTGGVASRDPSVPVVLTRRR